MAGQRRRHLLKGCGRADEVAAIVTHEAGGLSWATNGAAPRVAGGVAEAIL